MEIVLFFICIIGLAFMFFYFRTEIEKLRAETSRQRALLNKFIIEDVMLAEDAKSKNLFKQNVVQLARKMFTFLKKKYGLKATNYAELVEELKKLNLHPKFKDQLIDFFNSIILLEYSKESLKESEKRNLKKKAIEMIRRMGQIPTLQE